MDNIAKETYTSPCCETQIITPEGMICQSGTKGGPGSYDQFTNDWGDGWYE